MPEGNVGIAFAMVCGAGACTSLGAAMAFCVNLENKRFLAISLAVSCGVMFYVSMVEIFVKSLSAFSDEFCPERLVGEACPRGYGATTGFFFLGLAITSLLNMITSKKSLEFLCGKCGFKCFAPPPQQSMSRPSAEQASVDAHQASVDCGAGVCDDSEMCPLQPEAQPLPPGWEVRLTRGSMKPFFFHAGSKEFSWTFPGLQGHGHCACHTDVKDVDKSLMIKKGSQVSVRDVEMALHSDSSTALKAGMDGEEGVMVKVKEQEGMSTDLERNHPDVEDAAKLNATGLLTGLAIAIHNFPEGLATFVAAMADPSLGAAIAVAIAIHNVPEGVCVAMPIYYSTGSKMRAFMWATLSGVSEPVGALFGYLVLGGDVSNMAYGSMFGIVAGMMVYISLAELLPAAYRFDSNPAVVTASMVLGMVVMALSLLAFQL